MMRGALAILLLSLLAPGVRAGSDDLDELMRLLAQRRHGEVDFVEQHFMSLLKRPVESWGELIYDAPDRLEKRTLEPKSESLLLVGDEVTIRRGQQTRALELKAYPKILPMVESMRATLAGDRGALERVFRLEFHGDLDRWSLLLEPRDAQAARAVSRVLIEGSRDRLFTIEMRAADGDRSLLTLRERRAR